MAQIVDMTFTAEENDQTEALVPATTTATSRWRCQVDASWSETSDGIGMGFVLFEQEVEVLRGQCKGPQTESPLHAETKSLCWAMTEVSERRVLRVSFESDCQQLVHIIQQNKQWPALDAELDEVETMKSAFKEFSISFISRSANVCGDGLAKDVRSRVQRSSFVEVKDPLRLAIEASLYETF
ncbi:hypothetical protein Bca52824_081030 [Brassica carinata]|uniref:RNase H type-1 domain-containing protein n=1 Tax=Brassica carinata TaxID=52824 RepID=A0A8X7PEF5_BRACI|nr:PREDICTED: uncharacterized protein LOC106297368 [Brassica oleracea var. oleracea]KAG2250894.1 hypothetical protein Bca52824_081030 [Brassica carinata]